jgi:MFS family permease
VLVGVIGGAFALSAVVTSSVAFADPERQADAAAGGRGLLREMREGLATTMRASALRTVVLASAAAFLFSGMLNVAELLLAKRVLHAGSVGFSVLVAMFGVGILAGSLAGARNGRISDYKRRYLSAIVLLGIGLLAAGVAPNLATAAVAFAACGFANGSFLVHQRLLIQVVVPNRLLGRVFGVVDAAIAWAFAIAFLSGGALVAALGARGTLVLAGASTILVGLAAVAALRRAWPPGELPDAQAVALISQELAEQPAQAGSS